MYKKICNNIIIYFAVISLIFTAVPESFAQEIAPETIPKAQEELPAEPVEKATAPGNVTIDFKDADILNVLRILSIKSGVNIVAGKDVEGTVTIRLVDVPWEKALDVVLKTYGFAYEREANIIRVATVESLGLEPVKTEVFRISYAKAEDVAGSIKEIVSERGTVKADKRSNTLIVTDIPTNIYKVEQVVTKLDEPTPQVYIDARIIETVLDDDEKLGIDWTVQVTATGSKIPTTLPFDTSLRHMPYLENRVRESFPDFPTTDTSTATSALWTFGTLDFSSFQAVLKILDQRSDTKIISNPRTVTLDNQPAEIRVGSSLYIPKWGTDEDTGKRVFQDIIKTELDTGITLKVTPHVNSKNEIVIDLEPEVTSRQTKELLIGSADSAASTDVYAYPISVRNAKTQVMIKDGETIAIGGLLKEQTVKTRHKVPFLGDIPLLGYLFRYSADTTDTRDLLIFVTVKLIESKKDTEPLFKDITERQDEFYRAPETMGHHWKPDTPIGSGKSKKKSTRLIVE
ncbi:MAG: secretin and TonB N-terminal domain-containing protein [Candidatus Omnitrophota bacterium]|nr:MAG: secretin and TonB N-terminal domain-containing protein [Candidatus Omnitrophota bacterium]